MDMSIEMRAESRRTNSVAEPQHWHDELPDSCSGVHAVGSQAGAEPFHDAGQLHSSRICHSRESQGPSGSACARLDITK